MKKICIVCHTEIHNDPRVMRQIESLSLDYEVYVVGNGTPLQNVKFFSWDACYHVAQNKLEYFKYIAYHALNCFNKLTQRFSLNEHEELQKTPFHFVLVNELRSLPLGFLIAKDSPVHCDLHEYYLDKEDYSLREKLILKYYNWLCTNMLPQCMSLSTVSRGLVKLYEKITHTTTYLLINAPQIQNLSVYNSQDEKVRIVHHGYADDRRSLERYIEMMDYVDERFTLDLMLTTDSPYRKKLQNMAAQRNNVNWRDPVPMPEIAKTINTYDIGICSYPLDTLNNITYMLPNKFFEFIQARLAILTSPSPEMDFYINTYQIGKIAQSASARDLATALNSLTTQDILTFKNNSHKIAQTFSAEKIQDEFKVFLKEQLEKL